MSSADGVITPLHDAALQALRAHLDIYHQCQKIAQKPDNFIVRRNLLACTIDVNGYRICYQTRMDNPAHGNVPARMEWVAVYCLGQIMRE
jgi:hypothetical protein